MAVLTTASLARIGAEIHADTLVPPSRFTTQTMEQFAQSLSALLRELVRSPVLSWQEST